MKSGFYGGFIKGGFMESGFLGGFIKGGFFLGINGKRIFRGIYKRTIFFLESIESGFFGDL